MDSRGLGLFFFLLNAVLTERCASAIQIPLTEPSLDEVVKLIIRKKKNYIAIH